MKKGKWIFLVLSLGCATLICVVVVLVGVFGLSVFSEVAQEEFSPLDIVPDTDYTHPTLESQTTHSVNPLEDISYIRVFSIGYTDDADAEYDGIAIDIDYFNSKSEPMSFSGVPLSIDIKLYGYRDALNILDEENAELVYEGSVTIDHSMRIGEMLGHYIRIPYDEINVDENAYVAFGKIHVTVETPNGVFEDKGDALLYPYGE